MLHALNSHQREITYSIIKRPVLQCTAPTPVTGKAEPREDNEEGLVWWEGEALQERRFSQKPSEE